MKIFSLSIIVLLLTLSSNNYSQSSNNLKTEYTYLSPVPNSQMNSPFTNIIIKINKNLSDLSTNVNNINVTGSKSGTHQGKTIISDDGRTIIFNPYERFEDGETVFVNFNTDKNQLKYKKTYDFSFKFSISKQNLNTPKRSEYYINKEIKKVISDKNSYENYATEKMLKVNLDSLGLPSDFPQLYISVLSNPSPGYIFMSNFDGSAFNPQLPKISQPYQLILDNTGKPFFYRKLSQYCIDFKLQPNGLITYFDRKAGYFYAMNSQFSIVDSFYSGNGYGTNFHELQILPDGNYLVIGQDYEKVDMSKIVIGGDSNAVVFGMVIQELDSNKNVVFQWRSLDHFQITDATSDINLKDSLIDYAHTNAIELDTDGNILISSRHLDEITKINKETGDIMWRLGGENNEFTFINDDIGFSHQHDIRRLPNGNITLFDDGNLHWSQLQSRGVEYKLDEINKTAELVWQFGNTPDESSAAMGNMQSLADGNRVIGWGRGRPAVTEVTLQGKKSFELSLPLNVMNYRAFRFELDSTYKETLVPDLEYPLNNSFIEDTTINLQWSRNKFAQSFHLQLSKDSSFSSYVLEDSSLMDTSAIIDSLAEGVKYYWHVLSDNNTDSVGGYAGYSSRFCFTTLLKSPLNFSVTTSSQANFLSWDSVSLHADM